MRPVRRDELHDYVTWTEERARVQPEVLEIKRRRRVHVAEAVTLLFENRQTVRYQIQEMMRVEKMVKEAEIQHELATYNELLGKDGEIGATLLVEIDDPVERAHKLKDWLALPDRTYLKLDDGSKIFASFDARQKGEDRVSAVQFLKFDTQGAVPVAAGVDLPGLTSERQLTAEQREALRQDLAT